MTSRNSTTADVVIVGAGFAGAATAYHLARLGVRKITILDKEPRLAVHSSGRNAWMIRQVTPDAEIAKLCRRGAKAIHELDERTRARGDEPLLAPHGSLLLAAGPKVAALRQDAQDAGEARLDVELWNHSEIIKRFPLLERTRAELGCFCPSDGVVDVERLLEAYLDAARDAGATLLLGQSVQSIDAKNGRVRAVQTEESRIEAPVIVNAAGGWADEIATLAGASRPPLRATRRHIFISDTVDIDTRGWPFIWDLSDEVYFRPWHEQGRLMLSACEVLEPAGDLDAADVLPNIETLLRDKLRRRFPALAEIGIQRGWSGIRTLSPDGKFVIGKDPKIDGFHWVAGLGGHGVTASSAIGELAAESVVSGDEDHSHAATRFGT